MCIVDAFSAPVSEIRHLIVTITHIKTKTACVCDDVADEVRVRCRTLGNKASSKLLETRRMALEKEGE